MRFPFVPAKVIVATLMLSLSSATVSLADEVTEAQMIVRLNAPVSDILSFTVQNGYAPSTYRPPGGGANVFSLLGQVPIRGFKFFPWNQLTLLTMPTAVSRPDAPTAFGDIRLLDFIEVFYRRHLDVGIGATAIFPTATFSEHGHGKWQLGPSGGVIGTTDKWLLGIIIQNPISIGGDPGRPNTSEMIVWPFVTYNLGKGWFVRSEPQMVFDWATQQQTVPVNLGIGRVFRLGGQWMSTYVEPGWNTTHDGVTPQYLITVAFTLAFPGMWH